MSKEKKRALKGAVIGKTFAPDLFLGIEIHGEYCCGKKTVRVKEIEIAEDAERGGVRRTTVGKVYRCGHCGGTKRA
ncbi:MAG: hypothetical protein WC878_03415 [Candidatus Paceibacterota bacterium]|jgi:hypothetical protein